MNKDSKCPRQFGRKTLACRIGSKHFLFVLKSRKVFWTVITETFGVNALMAVEYENDDAVRLNGKDSSETNS